SDDKAVNACSGPACSDIEAVDADAVCSDAVFIAANSIDTGTVEIFVASGTFSAEPEYIGAAKERFEARSFAKQEGLGVRSRKEAARVRTSRRPRRAGLFYLHCFTSISETFRPNRASLSHNAGIKESA